MAELSLDLSAAFGNVVFHITVPRDAQCARVSRWSAYPNEEELLFTPYTEFVVTSRSSGAIAISYVSSKPRPEPEPESEPEPELKPAPPVVVIGISGPTRSGKSSLARALASRLGVDPEAIVCQDSFWRRAVQVTTESGTIFSEEEPACTDHGAFAQAIQRAVESVQVATASSSAAAPPAVVIAEGFQLLHDARVRDQLSKPFVVLDLTREQCIQRRSAPRSASFATPRSPQHTTHGHASWTCPDHARYSTGARCLSNLVLYAPHVRIHAGPHNPNPIGAKMCAEVVWPAHERYVGAVKQSLGPLGEGALYRLRCMPAASLDFEEAAVSAGAAAVLRRFGMDALHL